jgi:regulator of protease activity HflC (stomatin/prohibitin superfamily)
MKKALCVLSLMVFLYSCTRINPTEAGFSISNSGNYRGIDSLPLLTGYQWYFPFTTKIVTIPTTQQHIVWSEAKGEGKAEGQEITVSCLGGAGFKIDVGMNYRVNPFKASKIYLKYNTDDLESISETYLRNAVRGAMQDVSGTLTVDSILNNLPAFEHQVAQNLSVRLYPEGFIVDLFNILSQPRPTDADLAKSINAKIKAKQDAERTKMELQSSLAEAQKMIATARGDSSSRIINAMADAKAIQVTQAALSSSPQYVELIKAQKWNGVLPTVVTSGQGTFLQLKQ